MITIQNSDHPSVCVSGFGIVTQDDQNENIISSVKLQQWQKEMKVAEVAVPAVKALTENFVPVKESLGEQTGIAVANPTDSPITVTVNLYSARGDLFGGKGVTKTIDLPFHGHIAIFASELFPEIKNDTKYRETGTFIGRFKITASVPVPVMALGISVNANGGLIMTSLAANGQ